MQRSHSADTRLTLAPANTRSADPNGRQRVGGEGSGGLRLLLLGTHIGDRCVSGAIGFPRKRVSAAETEVLVGRVAGGPQTARPAEFEEIALRRGDRCADARRQRNAMELADD